MKIRIDHLEKMEGHLDFVGDILAGDVASAKIKTTEGIRLIESILVGRKYYDAPIITARICGICPVVHSLNMIKTVENAFGIKPSQQTIKLRKLMEFSQVIHSHALHLYFLSMPDFYGVRDDIDFIKQNPTQASAAIKIREFALKILEVVAGRAIHPIACEVGGFKILPSQEQLKELLRNYKETMVAAMELMVFAARLPLPQFERRMEFASLYSPDEYAIYDGRIKFLDGKIIKSSKYAKVIDEYQLLASAAKRANYQGKSYMVGALARLNINHDKLSKEAAAVVKDLKLKFPIYNTFANVLAQAIEVVHAMQEAGNLLSDLADNLKFEESRGHNLALIADANPQGRVTVGYSVMEAPRGILYDMVEINADGVITRSDIITPTVQYLNNIEEDLKVYLPNLKQLSDRQRRQKIKTLIRAYDPCISCATH
ncbi:MAG: Ni/Fe hydrogenase subunit alpha [Patescibacteria group bacterium]|jgi:coenzyme F420-reducing hydrogenase alpha subunit|nr:Ni/Fe hydrogenase subunit alpha [Patescibacteria group bacterium]